MLILVSHRLLISADASRFTTRQAPYVHACAAEGRKALLEGRGGGVAVTCTANDAYFGGKFVWSHRFQNMIILVRSVSKSNSKLGHVNLNAIEQTRNGGNLASMACGVRKSMSTQVAFILFFRFATFYALERINYSTR